MRKPQYPEDPGIPSAGSTTGTQTPEVSCCVPVVDPVSGVLSTLGAGIQRTQAFWYWEQRQARSLWVVLVHGARTGASE